MLAVTRRGQKTGESPETANGLAGQPLCHGAKSHRFQNRFHFAHLSGFHLLRTVLKAQFNGRNTGWREPQGRSLSDACRQRNVVLHFPLNLGLSARWQRRIRPG